MTILIREKVSAMKVKIIIFILLICPSRVLHAQSAEEKPGHLLVRLKNMPADTTRIATLLELAEAYAYMPTKSSRADTIDIFLREARHLNEIFKVNEFGNHIDLLAAQNKINRHPDQDAKQLLLTVIDRCRKTADAAGECAALQSLAYNLKDNSETILYKLDCYQQALRLARRLDDRQSAFKISRYIAEIHLMQGKVDLAERELLLIIKPDQQASYTNLLYTYYRLSELYIQKGEYKSALTYALKAVKTMQPAADSTYAFVFYNRLAQIHKDLGNLAESLKWAKKAYSVAMISQENTSIVQWAKMMVADRLQALGNSKEALTYILTDEKTFNSVPPWIQKTHLIQLGNCYQALKKYGLAEKSYLNLISLLNKNLFEDVDRAKAYQQIGNFYLVINKQDVARSFLLKALKRFQTAGSVKDLKDNFLLLFKAESAAGNYRQAMVYLQKSNKLKDAIFKTAKDKQLQELQIKFDTEQKNRDISALQNAAALQKTSLKNAEATRNWIIAGSCLLLIIAGLLYRQALKARRSNQVIQKKNQTLQQFLKEKEWLLKEVHHRVKNNLHTLICLLETQAKYLKDDALKAIETSQNRIFAMSLIHQKLYRSDDIKTINMAEYVPELIFNLERSFDISDQIHFDLNIAPIFLNVSYAIPFGLIINEAVTNAIKYAFPTKGFGTISVMLYQYQTEIVLTIADDGIGIPRSFNAKNSQSLGIELMKGLCQDISGEICFDTNSGTRIMVTCDPGTSCENGVPVNPESTSFARLQNGTYPY